MHCRSAQRPASLMYNYVLCEGDYLPPWGISANTSRRVSLYLSTILVLIAGGVTLRIFSEFKTDRHSESPEAAWKIAEKQRTTSEIQWYFIIFAGWTGVCFVIFNHLKSLYHHSEISTARDSNDDALHIELIAKRDNFEV